MKESQFYIRTKTKQKERLAYLSMSSLLEERFPGRKANHLLVAEQRQLCFVRPCCHGCRFGFGFAVDGLLSSVIFP